MQNNLKLFIFIMFGVLFADGEESKSFKFFSPSFYGNFNAGVQYYLYKEHDSKGNEIMSISGPMAVLNAMVGAKLNSLFKTDLELYYSNDLTKNTYNGALMDSSGNKTPYQSTSSDYYIGTVWRAGLIIGDGINEWLVLYLGFGYRYLYNHIYSNSSYQREQSYIYMPIGGRVGIWATNNIKIKLNVEFRALLSGKNKSHFSDIDRRYNDLVFHQSNGSGARVSAGVEFFIAKSIITVQGVFDFWQIGDSTKDTLYLGGIRQGDYIEPRNNTYTYGIEVGYAF